MSVPYLKFCVDRPPVSSKSPPVVSYIHYLPWHMCPNLHSQLNNHTDIVCMLFRQK